ncbi:MAG: PEP/pyruvate-binding domain-containing protein, partial [Planctomycetota bacterium]
DVASCERGGQHEQDRWSCDGVVTVPVEAAERDAPCLEPSVVAEIACLARSAAERRGRPQDIEWAWDGNRLWLLQSRPITTLDSLVDHDARAAVWDTANIAESYGGTTTPLTFSFASSVYAAVYRQFCVLMGVPRRTIVAKEEVFRGLLGLIRGRMHYDLLNWYRLLACFPGYRPQVRDCPLSWSRWLHQSTCALAAGAPVLVC